MLYNTTKLAAARKNNTQLDATIYMQTAAFSCTCTAVLRQTHSQLQPATTTPNPAAAAAAAEALSTSHPTPCCCRCSKSINYFPPNSLLLLLLGRAVSCSDLYSRYPAYILAALVTATPPANISRRMVCRRACYTIVTFAGSVRLVTKSTVRCAVAGQRQQAVCMHSIVTLCSWHCKHPTEQNRQTSMQPFIVTCHKMTE
jgi:hypothetical protein